MIIRHIKKWAQRKSNHYRRKAILGLLGEPIILKKSENDEGCTFEVISENHRLTLGKFKAVRYEKVQVEDSVVISFVILKV